jgi:hypothetical protein
MPWKYLDVLGSYIFLSGEGHGRCGGVEENETKTQAT